MAALLKKLFAALLAGIAASPILAQQNYPNKPVRLLLVDGAAGAITDIVMRTAAPDLGQRLGQPLIIENRAGGSGVPGMEACVRSPADGHTACVVNITAMSFNPHTLSRLPYDPDKDIKAVAHLYYVTEGLFVSGSVPVHSVKELQGLAASKPGYLNFGTPGAGSNLDIYREWLGGQWKTSIVGVNYKGFTPIVTALVSGEVHLSKMGLGNLMNHVRAGKIRALAVSSSKRLRSLADVQTMQEAGIDGFPVKPWWGMVVPAGTPDAAIARLNAELVRQFQEPRFAEFMENQYIEGTIGTPQAFAAFMKADRERIGQMVRQFNIPRQ